MSPHHRRTRVAIAIGMMVALTSAPAHRAGAAAIAATHPIPDADSSLAAGAAGFASTDASVPDATVAADGLEHLVPELAASPYALEPGVRPYLHRLAFSPAVGRLGSQELFVLRATYYPNAWLGYEGSVGHNPSHAVQAVLHRFSAIVRRPLPGRFQPYASAGYGMTIVLPGKSLNADAVTKNALTYGGGLELFIRSDLALRAEMLGMTVIGRQQFRTGVVAYEYREATIALAFYRTLRP
jgi:hypothetical protein